MKRTPLYEEHKSLGAKLVPFAGWEMPLQYSGIVDEHHTVRKAVGLFDVSHMGELVVEGPGALASPSCRASRAALGEADTPQAQSAKASKNDAAGRIAMGAKIPLESSGLQLAG